MEEDVGHANINHTLTHKSHHVAAMQRVNWSHESH